MVDCPNKGQGCSVDGIRADSVAAHREVCRYESVPCRYVGAGCTARVMRKDVEAHEDAAMKQHNRLLLANMARLEERANTRWQALEQSLTTQSKKTEKTELLAEKLTDEVRELKEKVEELEGELEARSEELKGVQTPVEAQEEHDQGKSKETPARRVDASIQPSRRRRHGYVQYGRRYHSQTPDQGAPANGIEGGGASRIRATGSSAQRHGPEKGVDRA